jgi:membrane dipeptidase
MIRTASLALLSVLVCACTSAPHDVDARARELARELLILDGHVDVPYRLIEQQKKGGPIDDVGAATAGGDFDWPRAVAGGLDAPFMSIYTPSELEAEGRSKAVADELIDLMDALAARHPERVVVARTAAAVRAAAAAGKLALLYGMENGSPIAGSLANLEHFWRRGVRYITLTHGKDNHLCDSSYDQTHTHKGLSPFGREVVRRMNELGILIDVSHISDDTFWQVMELTATPVIASHSSLRHFTPGFERNLSDDMVRRLAENGGVVQINFGSSFLTEPANQHALQGFQAVEQFRQERGLAEGASELEAFAAEWRATHPFPYATVADVADHIERVIELVGVEHVGFGSDFDGVGDTLPVGLKDVSMFPNLIAELLRRGHSEHDLALICGENVLRVMAANEAYTRKAGN